MNELIAAIDIGTNSFHLVIAKIDSKGRFTVITRAKEVVRLGSSSNDMKYLSPEAMDRGVEALKRFKMICDSYKAKITAVATSATREALNKDDFISRVKSETGIDVNIVSGFEEARLIYLGVLQSLNIFDKRILLVDIGGGSTEFLIGEKGNVIYANSTKIGAVRLSNKFSLDKKISGNDLKNAEQFVKGVLSPVIRHLSSMEFELAVGSSGTIMNIGTIINAENLPDEESDFNMNGFVIRKKQLVSATETIFQAETLAQRLSIPGLDPKRADIITAGAVILKQIFDGLGLEKMTVSNYALREGIISNQIQQSISHYDFGNQTDVRYGSVLHLGENTNFDRQHSFHVLGLAVRIFDFLKNRYSLTPDDKIYLEAACILHDVGHHISHNAHHKHSYYIIRNSELLGFNDREIEIIANVARYHRKSHPKTKHEGFGKLDMHSRELVRRLSGILRLADALDRSHKSIVKNIELVQADNTLRIRLTECDSEPSLEIWGANLRKGLFEESFGLKVEIENKIQEPAIA
jgi:exopolyphosphatase/guanosine-5'-triphosphate,3'-diphosphate pyrophosphatase